MRKIIVMEFFLLTVADIPKSTRLILTAEGNLISKLLCMIFDCKICVFNNSHINIAYVIAYSKENTHASNVSVHLGNRKKFIESNTEWTFEVQKS